MALALCCVLAAGCISPRVVKLAPPQGRGQSEGWAGRDLYLTRFTLRHIGLRDSAADVEGLRRQFLDYLAQRGGFRNVVDATAAPSAGAAPDGPEAVSLEVDADLGLSNHPNLLLGWPVFWPFFGFWPVQPRHGQATVSASAAYFGPGHRLLASANPSRSADYSLWLYGWYRTGPIQEAFRKAYTEVFGELSSPRPPAGPQPAPQTATQSRALSSTVDRPSRKAAPRPQDFALIVGIESYRSAPKAEDGERDAAAFREYAREALGVPEENTVFLTGQSASRSDLAKYVEEWLPRNVGEQSRVYVFYSGHGAPDPISGTAYLVPWDGDPAFLQTTAYPLPRLYEKLGTLKAKETVVFLDSCFSGAGGRSLLAQGVRPLVSVQSTVPASSRLSVLAAASGSEVAGTEPEQGHGLFTYFLLKGLQGEAAASGHVTLADLQGYLKRTVTPAARRQNREQTPQLLSSQPRLRLY